MGVNASIEGSNPSFSVWRGGIQGSPTSPLRSVLGLAGVLLASRRAEPGSGASALGLSGVPAPAGRRCEGGAGHGTAFGSSRLVTVGSVGFRPSDSNGTPPSPPSGPSGQTGYGVRKSRLMKGDFLAFLGLSDRGEALTEGFGIGGFFLALALSLIPMPMLARAGIVAAGVVGAYVFMFAYSEYGLDRLGWAIILTTGVIGWLLGFAVTGAVRASRRSAVRNSDSS